mgnify:CR=1 FL=1
MDSLQEGNWTKRRIASDPRMLLHLFLNDDYRCKEEQRRKKMIYTFEMYSHTEVALDAYIVIAFKSLLINVLYYKYIIFKFQVCYYHIYEILFFSQLLVGITK